MPQQSGTRPSSLTEQLAGTELEVLATTAAVIKVDEKLVVSLLDIPLPADILVLEDVRVAVVNEEVAKLPLVETNPTTADVIFAAAH